MKLTLSALVTVGLLIGSNALQAHARAFFSRSNSPQQGQENVLYTFPQTDTSVFSFLSQNAVIFSSPETLQITALGQTKLTSTDTLINSVTIIV